MHEIKQVNQSQTAFQTIYRWHLFPDWLGQEKVKSWGSGNF
jgi:hypothetical protein